MIKEKIVLDEMKAVMAAMMFQPVDGDGRFCSRLKGRAEQCLSNLAREGIIPIDFEVYVHFDVLMLETGLCDLYFSCSISEFSFMRVRLGIDMKSGDIKAEPFRKWPERIFQTEHTYADI